MPKKNVKKSSKRSSSPTPGEKTADVTKTVNIKEMQNQNEASLQGYANKKPKKQAKQALTKQQRKIEELEKASTRFQSNSKEYEQFLNRMDNWLKTNHQQAMKLFSMYDRIGNGILQYDEFKLGMRDLKIPCVEAQLHILTKLLDQDNNGTIDYTELGAGLDIARCLQSNSEENEEEDESKDVEGIGERVTIRKDAEESETRTEAEPCLSVTKEVLTRCPDCLLRLRKHAQFSESRYISVELRIITFNNMKTHPGHFQEVVFSQMKVYGLIGRIQGHTGIASNKLSIFKDQSYSQKSLLPLDLTLEECGFHSGPLHSPPTLLLYYDYSIEFSDCPILNCDYYFTTRKL
ncbi:uncharacterized protein LOC125463795 [Stegostoma tigrinum]|uniref:uncharacterized protein LOC125463795 n=1 Tax=Stegostoma tigrinum TaxID=3053191 RepID=UPI00202B323B|nr:uncharacterized protein LOC125463795 [Stegostoma tigrinum]